MRPSSGMSRQDYISNQKIKEWMGMDEKIVNEKNIIIN